MNLQLRITLSAALCLLTAVGCANPKPSTLNTLTHWSHSCEQLVKDNPSLWKQVCQLWQKHPAKTENDAAQFFKLHFKPTWQTTGNTLITGYYAPVIKACRKRSKRCDSPIVDLPDEKTQALSRQQINHLNPHKLPVLAWTSRSDRFFLQIQGSGVLLFEDGSQLHVGYAGKNEYPYSSIGHYLDKHALISKSDLNMPGIKHYLQQHYKQQQDLLEHNQSFVFFKKQKEQGVIGNLGVTLKKELSAAVDKSKIPLGAILTIDTTDPFEFKPWQLMLVAQDTGSAINGRYHVDVYMGSGKKAGDWAGQMHQNGKIIYYLPRKLAKASK